MKPSVASASTLISPDALQAFGTALARLAAELAANIVEERLRDAQAERYATAKENPLGSKRQFLDAARAGSFESFKSGREVVARWRDVERFIESTPPTRRPKKTENLEAELQQAATPRRGRARRG
jgi:hypothetical protein